MRHQVERLKHVALRQGVKPARALTATLVAVGMMVTGSVVLGSSTANADDGHNNGAICTSTTEPLGDQTSGSGNDEGIATFVGGDMYVGGKKSGITSAKNNNAPEGSYAVEAEGLTAVNGKLLLHPMKQAWNIWNKDGSFNRSRGFRWGIVGFGSQFRPKDGSTVLSVGGNSTNSELNWFGGAQGWTDNANQGSSWLGTGAGNGATGETNDHNFNANIAGNQTTVQSRNNWKNGEQYSVYAMGGNGKVNWNGSKTVISGVKNPSTGSDYTYSDYKKYVATLSGKLANIPSSNTVTKGNNEDNYTGSRYSYGYNTYEYNVYRFDIQNNSRQTEITLTGNGKDELQVFNLDASMLNSIGDAGVVFNFKNISDNASVAVNINGNGNDVKFRNGWQFKWNDVDISDGYVMMNSTGENRYNNTHGQEYVKRASQLMWNFYNTNSLTILGGKGGGHINTGWYKNQNHGDKEDWYNVNVTDDPSAAWMGSVMVTGNDSGAAGNFQSHVSTNGRVWTTGDFEMYNKDVVTTGNGNFVNSEGKYSTSAVDMDQERHNLQWNGQLTTSCSTIQWSKVDTSGKALGGTTWSVYGTKNDAVAASATPLTTITDNGWNDGNDADGEFSLTGLTANATYYIKETSTGGVDYQLNENVYRIDTGDEGASSASITAVYDKNGNEITDDSAKTLLNGKIVNKKRGSSLAWSKVDADSTDTKLAGSTWNLTKYTDETRTNVEEGWPKSIKDNTVKVTGVTIKDLTTGAEYGDGQDLGEKAVNSVFRLSATVAPSGAPSGVVWSSSNDYYATVDAGTGIVTPKSNSGNDYVSITACSTSNTDVCASVKFKVAGATAAKVSVSPSPATVVEGKTTQLTATVNPQQDVSWSSNNELVAKVDQNGLVTGVSAGTATITASTANGTFDSVTVTVTSSKQYLTLYFDSYKQGPWSANNVQVHYRLNDNVTWADQHMTQMSGSCGQYAYARILMDEISVDSQFGFRHLDGSGWYGPGNANVPKSNGNFKFTSGTTLPENVTISAGPNYSPTAPSGCAASSASVQSSKSSKVVRKAAKVATQASGAGRLANAAQSELIDEDTDPGAFRISDFADGYYVLKETGEPNGFDIGGEYKITITNGQVTWDPAKTGNKLPNKRKTGMVTWNKVDKTNGTKLLGGSEWKLTQTKSFSWVNGKALYTDANKELATITDCVDSSETQCAASTDAYADIDGAAGQFKITGLAWGEYKLVEKKAPAGYDLDSKTEHVFRIGPAEGSDVTGEWYTSSGFKTDTTGAYDANTAFTVDGGSITNTPGVVLPSTGGEGVNKMYTAGFLAVAIAVAGLALSLRRRQS